MKRRTDLGGGEVHAGGEDHFDGLVVIALELVAGDFGPGYELLAVGVSGVDDALVVRVVADDGDGGGRHSADGGG